MKRVVQTEGEKSPVDRIRELLVAVDALLRSPNIDNFFTATEASHVKSQCSARIRTYSERGVRF